MPMRPGLPSAGFVSGHCKLCRSPHRAEAERLRFEGVPIAVIRQRLQGLGEQIGAESLRRHFVNHADVQGLVAEKYAESATLQEIVAGKRLSDVQRLDEIIEAAHERAMRLGAAIDALVAEGKTAPMSLVQAYSTSLSEHRQAIKQKADLLGEQPEDGIDRLLAALWGGETVGRVEALADDDDPGEGQAQ